MNEMKPTQGVMIHVRNDVDRFVGTDDNNILLDKYKTIFKSINESVEQMSAIEELILQQRCMSDENLKHVKLSVLREYVYARCPFYRRNKSTKDIRVIVSRIDIIDPNNPNPSLDDLYSNKEFMEKATQKLALSMVTELQDKLKTYYEIYEQNIDL